MTKIMKSLFDMMNLQSLYELVLNSCVCECLCCSNDYGCKCYCNSKEIDHPPPDNEMVEVCRICCNGENDIVSDVESIISDSENDPRLFQGKKI